MIEQFKIIEASAGTGKTFSLSSQLILLLASNVAPSKILALTFTKKAAGEIRNRVYERLAKAALCDLQALELSKQIGIPVRTSSFYAEILNKILTDNKRIDISTIDGFFNKIARLLSFELTLPHRWMVADQNQHKTLAIEAILKTFEDSKEQQIELLNLIQLLNRDQAAKSIINKISGLTKDFIDNYKTKRSGVLEFATGSIVNLPNSEVLSQNLSNLKLPLTKQGVENANWRKAIDAAIHNINNKDWEGFLAGGVAKVLINNGSNFHSIEISEDVKQQFTPAIEIARNHLLTKFRARALSARRLLDLISGYYLQIKHSQTLVTFTDILDALESNSYSREDLYSRLDNKFDHILIDEFQDTSLAQWRILEPFINELVTESSKTCFVVGDKKQAIYGWRGGNSKIFQDFKESYPQAKVQQLNKSYRSAQAIIDNVNRVFNNLSSNQALIKYPEIVNRWSQQFVEHATDISDTSGYVRYEYLSQESIYEIISERIKALSTKDVSIGVLVLTNTEVHEVIKNLANANIISSMESGTFLTQSSFVKALVASINLIENPYDTEQFFLICCSPLGQEYKDATIENALAYSQYLISELEALGFAKFVQNLACRLSQYANYSEQLRLNKVVEMAYLFESSDYSLFCETVSQTKFAAPSEQKIKVMTVHQSKGLEFDIVILPHLARTLDKIKGNIIFSQDLNGDPIMLPYPNETIRALSNEISSSYSILQNEVVEDSLSVLYVALTRAKKELYVYLAKPKGLSLGKILIDEFFGENNKDNIFEINSAIKSS